MIRSDQHFIRCMIIWFTNNFGQVACLLFKYYNDLLLRKGICTFGENRCYLFKHYPDIPVNLRVCTYHWNMVFECSMSIMGLGFLGSLVGMFLITFVA